MLQIKICLDKTGYSCKPRTEEVSKISKRIYKLTQCNDISILADLIGNKGHTFTPAVFDGVARKAENVTEIQLLCLDFDNDISKGKKMTISFEEATERSYKLGLPIAFAYETFSSLNKNKFRIVYTYCEPIVNHEFYNIMINALHSIFPESDSSTKDISRLFFGGKRLLTGVSDKTISGSMIFSALNQYFSKPRRMTDKIENFALKNGVDLKNYIFHTDEIDTKELENVKNLGTPIIYNRLAQNFDQIFVIYKRDENNSYINKRVQNSDFMIEHADIDEICKKCKLLNEFKLFSRELSYIEKWGILTNIIHIKGGGKWFKNIMKHIEEIAPLAHDFEKWNSNLFQMKKSPYSPQRCCNYCQYCTECNHSKNILTTAIPSMYEINIIENKRNYVGIDTARNQLHEAMINVLSDRDNSIHIIKAPTGLGKTQEYINCMKLSAKPFIIAVPTNKLKLEVFNRCINAGITDIVFTPEIPSEIGEKNINKLKMLYTKGDIHGYSKFLKILESEYPCMLQYKKNLQMTLTSKGHIITTHIRLINDMFGDDILSSHEIIIDEDIIKNILVTTKIPKKSLKNIIFNGNTTLSELLKTYYIPANSVMSSVCLKPMKINEKIPPKEYSELVKTADINFNVNDLLSADAAYISGDYIYYAVIRKIPDKKLIIMSATASDFVYKNLLKDRTIKLHNIGNVHYKGKVIQYHNKSYSRNYISSNTEVFDRIKRYHKGYNLITFLKYSRDIDELHFGNTEGKDTFDDKDLLIIGTPFQDEAVYKLLAVSMGFDCNEINKSRLNHRTVEVNEYKFTFFNYDYDPLKEIQLYIISSELEQAVGRARLLNNKNTVYVYSCMPVSQAEFHEIDPLLTDKADKKDTPKECDSFEEE